MTMETKVRVPELKFNRVRWLFDGIELQWMRKNGHTLGSVVTSLPIEALSREVIRNDIVFNSMLYTA